MAKKSKELSVSQGPAAKRKYYERVMGPREPNAAPEHRHVRSDGWRNLVTGIGTDMDKRTHSHLNWELHQPEFYEQMYAGGGIPARIVDLIPEHALRRWVDWVNVENYDKDEVEERSLELNLRGSFLNSWKWGRAYGGGVLHIVTDTVDPASPLRRGEKVLALRDLSRWDLRILTTDIEYDFGSSNFSHPRIYYLNVQMGSQYKGYPIHWSRMIRFDGQLVPRRTYIRNNYWHDSILNRLYNSIRNFEMAYDAAAACLQDFNVDVYKMNNVASMMSAGKEEYIRSRIEMMAFTKSVINAMILDAKDEEYENKGRSLEGVAEMLDKVTNRLVADTDIPHTILLGESPDGSNATGNSTSQGWYNFLGAEQENYAKPKLNRLVDVIYPERKKMRPRFRPLRVLDELETANMRKTVAETDAIYESMGALDPSEITDSRFGGDEYSTETKIDKESRAAGLITAGSAHDLDDDPDDPDGGGNGGVEGNLKESKPKRVAGDQPPEGKSKEEPGPSDKTEVKNKPRPPGKQADMTGREKSGNDSEPAQDVFHAGMGESEFEPRNAVHPVNGGKPATQSFISQTMSEPMRDPRTDPRIKGPGIPNEPRTFLPTRGTGVMAQSGFDFVKDAGKKGSIREVSPHAGNQGSNYAKADAFDPCVYIVRHGSTDMNGDEQTDRIRGWAEIPLSNKGKEDASRAADTVANVRQPIIGIVSSGLGRADDTAAEIAERTGLKHVKDPRLKPWDLGQFTGKLTKDVKDEMQSYTMPGKQDIKVPGGESFREFLTRFLTALQEYMVAPVPYVLVTHLRNVKATQAWIEEGTPMDLSVDVDAMKPDGDFPGMVMAVYPDGTMDMLNRGDAASGPKADVERMDFVRKIGSKWVVLSHEGKHLGSYASKEEANKRLGQIEYFKQHGDGPVEEAMKAFAKGKLKSGSGHKVTDPAQAAAIGYAQKRGDSAMRAATVIVKKGDKFLMGRRRDTGRWTLPGGVIEPGESHHQGAVRELFEETGIKASKLKFLGGRIVEPEQGKQVHLNMYEYAYDEARKPSGKLDPDKEINEFKWLPISGPLSEDVAGNLQHPNNVALDFMRLLR